MNVLKICLATCGTFLLSATSAHAVAISGSFDYDATTLTTTFVGSPSISLPAGSVTFNFDTSTNSGTASGFDILSSSKVFGTIITTGPGTVSTFDHTTMLFKNFVARYAYPGQPSGTFLYVDFRTDFGGQGNGGSVPFSIKTVTSASDGNLNPTQFIQTEVDGNISSFVQAVPYEFESAIGIALYGGFFVTRKLLKARNNKNLRN